MEKKLRILIVDNDPRYRRALQIALEFSNYQVESVVGGRAALHVAATTEPDLILMDIPILGMDDYETCRRIREFSTVPIIIVTAQTETANKVKALDMGADDYITKPFNVEELLARVRSVLRRWKMHSLPTPEIGFQAGNLHIDYARQLVRVGDRKIALTPTEYRLLCELANQVGRVVVPEILLERVWGVESKERQHLIWQTIHRLRRKIENDPQNPQYIQTHGGVGYILSSPS